MSQFTIYSSDDAGAPQLAGTAGSLLAVLDACLVSGYGSKAAAGWTKPIANAGNCGHYLQGSGSGYHLFVNDNGPNGTSTYAEAWVTGWKTMSAITAPVGVGSGQFPLPYQQLTTGHCVVRKAVTANSTVRQWKVFADSSTMYLFILANNYTAQLGWDLSAFGDFFSLAGSSDIGRCWIAAKLVENNIYNNYTTSTLNYPTTTNLSGQASQAPTEVNYRGSFSADAPGGNRGSYVINPYWDRCFMNNVNMSQLSAPNPVDRAIYLTPVYLTEPMTWNVAYALRGRARGLWATMHLPTSFITGQVIAGTGDFLGKSFMAMRIHGNSDATTEQLFFVETSNTLDTN